MITNINFTNIKYISLYITTNITNNISYYFNTFYKNINNKPLYICIYYNNIFILYNCFLTYLIIKSKYIKKYSIK